MSDFFDALDTAARLIARLDPELRDIIVLSLAVSLTASVCAFLIGAPLGTALAVYRFRGRGALIVIANALLGLPPVVVGLAVYLLLSRSTLILTSHTGTTTLEVVKLPAHLLAQWWRRSASRLPFFEVLSLLEVKTSCRTKRDL
jgi:ABC-type spermidine/putrescine transport system permease subunit II